MNRLSKAALALAVILALGTSRPSRAEDVTSVAFITTSQDVALGLFSEMDPFKRAVDATSYHDWLKQPWSAKYGGKHFTHLIRGAMDRAVATPGARIEFNLTSLVLDGKDGALVVTKGDPCTRPDGTYRVTAWELAQIRYTHAYWEIADFYVLRGQKYVRLPRDELAKLGIAFEGEAKKSKLAGLWQKLTGSLSGK